MRSQYGVVKFPNTQLDDAGHIAFASRFGELDDGKQSGPRRAARNHEILRFATVR